MYAIRSYYDDQLSLAIGRQGQNVRLASRLLGWKIDVKSEQRYANLENPGYRSLVQVEGVDEGLADRLFAGGIVTSALLASTEIEQLMSLARIDQEKAQLIQLAAGAVASPDLGGEVVADEEQEAAEQAPTGESEDNQSTEQE